MKLQRNTQKKSWKILMKVSVLAIFFITSFIFADAGFLKARLTANAAQVKSFCQSDEVKIVFSNYYRHPETRQTYYQLYYVDFSEGQPQIRRMKNIEYGIVPVISPDGTMVTFATGVRNDGATGQVSTAWYAPLSEAATATLIATPGYVPRFVQNAVNPSVIYSTASTPLPGKNHIWDGSGQVLQKDLVTGTITPVITSGSYLGGMSYSANWIATSESSPNAFLLDLQNQQNGPDTLHILPVKKNGTDTDTIVSLQCCNPSISSSRLFENVMMYFDFSSDAILVADCYHPTMGYWGFHDRIFIARNDRTILKYYDVPSEIIDRPKGETNGMGQITEKKWNYPEWSNHPYYAASAVEIDRYWADSSSRPSVRCEQLYILNLKDSTYLKIIETTDTTFNHSTNMQYPWVWIKTPDNFAAIEDTAWLKYSHDVISTVPSQRREFGTLQMHLSHNRLMSNKGIQNVILYDLNGRQLWKSSFSKPKMIVQLPSMKIQKCYLVSVTLKNNLSRQFTLMNITE